jgi:succinate dehydrogenase/fumarate reductase-like Fe-S protein
MQTYAVDMNQCGPMILDALIKVKVVGMLSFDHDRALHHS